MAALMGSLVIAPAGMCCALCILLGGAGRGAVGGWPVCTWMRRTRSIMLFLPVVGCSLFFKGCLSRRRSDTTCIHTRLGREFGTDSASSNGMILLGLWECGLPVTVMSCHAPAWTHPSVVTFTADRNDASTNSIDARCSHARSQQPPTGKAAFP
ncbi:hypothetical protein F5144DRAFT_213995 [Chaetomium tenue]|uniref:Uncharacterized protein n=1 Tax=Chaetomium tenue TaxID=1854479 RepID=A0ACB7P4Y5_9PEZI|nr:hypothetical protein F5144DRAFT_213995 [Chaetomium globosum]